MAFEMSQDYLKSSIFRFMGNASNDEIKKTLDALNDPEADLWLNNVDVIPAETPAESPKLNKKKAVQCGLFG